MLSKALMAAAGTTEEIQFSDDVFSTYLYTGTGTTQTINNGIDLAGKGGMVWTKARTGAIAGVISHTARSMTFGATGEMQVASNAAAYDVTNYMRADATGYTLGTGSNYGSINATTSNSYVSWTFRHASKFYNTATLTKSPGVNATVSFPTLGQLGMVRVKRTDATGSWYVWHRSATAGHLLIGETTAASSANGMVTVSGTTVTLVDTVIANGQYIIEAYAHDSSPEGLIQCGSFATDGSGNATVTLGWEPQYLMFKRSNSTGDWGVVDVARGWNTSTSDSILLPNSSNVESSSADYGTPTSTGFSINGQGFNGSATYIYLAIRRPNKPPTTGTQVYNAIARTGTGAAATVTGVGFAPDLVISKAGLKDFLTAWFDRIRGKDLRLATSGTNYENIDTDSVKEYQNDGILLGADPTGHINASGYPYINWIFKRTPGVFDTVCYSPTATAPASEMIPHSLTVAPEFTITKSRATNSVLQDWRAGVWTGGNYHSMILNSTQQASTTPSSNSNTATTFFIDGFGDTRVAYLFATKTGISKVGSYTGNGTSLTVNCDFTTGARFILIKRTDAAGDWYVWDTTRGIVAGNDPHLSLNTTAAEVTTDDSIDPDNSGFIVNQVAATNINVNAATYIYLAIA